MIFVGYFSVKWQNKINHVCVACRVSVIEIDASASETDKSSIPVPPHTGSAGPSPAAETRCSGCVRRVRGVCWCFHTSTGASA